MKHSKSSILSLLFVLSLGLCTPTLASFDTDSLYMSVYNNTTTTGDVEFGFSTGFNLETVDWSNPVNYQVETGLSTDLFNDADWADLRVGFFGNHYLTPTSSYGQFYMASLSPDTVPNGTQRTAYRTATEGVKAEYNLYDTDNDGTALLTNNLSGGVGSGGYDFSMNGAGTSPGQYNGFNVVDAANGEGELEVFGDADPNNDAVTMYLVGYQRLSFGDTGGSLTNGLMPGVNYLATITLEADGTLIISNAPPEDCPDGDADEDGVCDGDDDCPDTVAGAEVDANGCAENQRDSDGDGVFDDVDQCSGTPAGTPVDSVGCPLPIDSDGDGVPDSQDQCPGIPDVHSDGDNVANCIDTDDDNDNLPDDCELQWGLNPLVANASDGDLDDDGFTDSQECQSGFNPNSNTSQPARPTALAEDQAVSSGESVILTATATQGTNPIAAFAWSQTEGTAVTPSQADDIPNRRSTITFTAPAVASGQTATLRFAITVSDSVGIASSPATAVAVTVQSTGNNPPSSPGLHAPAIDPVSTCQVTTPTPVLTVSNATDIDGDDIEIEFSAARDLGFTDLLTPTVVVPQGSGGTTEWIYSGDTLGEDTLYYWRARACDDGGCSDFMDPIGFFFVNAVNAAPTAPELVSPEDGASVSSLTPIFTVDLAPYTGTTDRYDTHTYRLLVSTGSSFASGIVVDQTYSCAAGGEQDAWQVNPGGNLTEDATYYWRVVYGDDGGGIHTAFSGQTATRSFIVNGSTNAPGTPSELSPSGGGDVTIRPVTLRFVNNGDLDSPVLDFEVELSIATGAAFEENILQTIPITDVDRDQTEISVQVADLTENQRYYWRVTVTDGEGNTAQSATADFRFNADNEPPGAPQAIQPGDHAVWSTYAPTFIVNVQGDSEGDPVYCLFEVFTEENGELITSSQRMAATRTDQGTLTSPPYPYTCAWRLNSTGLSNNTTYRWVATAFDGQGAEAAYSASAFRFTTAVNFYQPTAPTLNNPYSGGTVRELEPALSVFRSSDDDGNNISYQFELYPCPNLSCQPVSLALPVERVQTVEATPVSALLEDRTYYWRVRAMDKTDTNEGHASAWMPTASFTVDSDGSAATFDAQIDLSQIARYGDEETQRFTVTGSDEQDMVGVQVAIPAGAIPEASGDINLQIGHATRAPALPIGKAAVGTVIFLAPEGFQFARPVSVRIPVVAPGSDDPAGLQVLTYNAGTREWIQVPGTLVDNGLTMEIQVRHFSLYTLALDDPITPGGGEGTGGGGGGGGGCFIGSLE